MGRPPLALPGSAGHHGLQEGEKTRQNLSKEAASVQASPLNLTPALGTSTVELCALVPHAATRGRWDLGEPGNPPPASQH